MHRPVELRAFLDRLGIRPKKSLSQNFLIDKNILDKILILADVKEGDLVVEVGPGPGALTEQLLAKGAKVIAIEKDAVYAKELERFDGNLKVYCEDVLEVDWNAILDGLPKAKVVANLPYHITTPILTALAPKNALFTSLTVMVQDEVAKRFTGKPGTKDFGSITVYLEYFSKIQYGFKISPNSFYPPPKVHSAIVHFQLEKRFPVKDEEAFFQMVRSTFEARRKMVTTTLKKRFSVEAIEKALKSAGCRLQARPEDISLEQWVTIYKYLLDPDCSRNKM